MNEVHAYTAGLIDGEGTITISRQTAKDQYRRPIISLTSTTPELCFFLKENYGGCISKQRTYQSHHKPSMSWKIQGNVVFDFLTKIISFLKEPEKKRRARLLLDVYKSVTPRNGRYDASGKIRKLEFEKEFMRYSTKFTSS